jgi:hypothetical protein
MDANMSDLSPNDPKVLEAKREIQKAIEEAKDLNRRMKEDLANFDKRLAEIDLWYAQFLENQRNNLFAIAGGIILQQEAEKQKK